MSRSAAVVLFLLVAIVALLAGSLVNGGLGFVRNEPAKPPPDPSVVTVMRVVDGDTIHVQFVSGASGPVRYIGVDTPESVKPGSEVECFGRRASAFNERLVEGRRVRLVQDVERHDRFGRLLAYVYRESDGLFVNAELIRRGYAQPLTIPPNVRFADRFYALAVQARAAGRGLWSAC